MFAQISIHIVWYIIATLLAFGSDGHCSLFLPFKGAHNDRILLNWCITGEGGGCNCVKAVLINVTVCQSISPYECNYTYILHLGIKRRSTFICTCVNALYSREAKHACTPDLIMIRNRVNSTLKIPIHAQRPDIIITLPPVQSLHQL